jgi:hypothetical protein
VETYFVGNTRSSGDQIGGYQDIRISGNQGEGYQMIGVSGYENDLKDFFA